MADVDALVVKLEADLKTFRSEMTAAAKLVAQSTSNMEKELHEMGKKGGGAFDFLKLSAATAVGFIGSEAILGTLRSAKDAMVAFVSAGIQEAKQQEDAIQRLNSALAQSGRFSASASREMQEFASALQATTRFGDDAVLETSALIQSLGRLDTEGLKGATTAALDLSTALGVDLKTAATLVGKAAAGEVASFSRYGIAISEGNTKADTFRNTLEALNRQFGGSAANAVKTYSGITEQLSNTYGDLQEEAGMVITQSGALVGAMTVLNEVTAEAAKFVQENRGALQSLVADGILLLAEGIPLAVDALKLLNQGFSLSVRGVDAVRASFKLAIGDFKGANQAAQQFWEGRPEEKERAAALDSLSEKAQGLRDRLVEAATQGTEAQTALNDQLQRQSDLQAILSEGTTALSEMEQQIIEKKLEDGARLQEADVLRNTNALALVEERTQAELAALQRAEEMGLLTKEQFDARWTAISAKGSEDRKKIARAEADARIAATTGALDVLAGAMGSAAELSKSFGKEGFAAYKAFATAEATISAISGSVKAFESAAAIPIVGFILAPIAAAAALAAGVAKVAKIQSTTPKGFQKGGEIPGIGFGDKVPIMAEPGETMIDRSTTKKLKQSLNGEGGLLGEIQLLRADIRAMMGSFPRSFQIIDLNGRVLMDVINGELRSGRTLAVGAV